MPLLASLRSRLARSIAGLSPIRSGGWFPLVVHEPYTGAWQRNEEIRPDTVLAHPAVFACISLIMSDIGKCRLRLVELDDDGIWAETTSAAYSPVLRKPNRYQTIIKFVEQWITSLLVHGNAFTLKQRDDRNVVIALYVLDPHRVKPLVAPDGAIYYELSRDDLANVPQGDPAAVVVPQSEIIHDRINCLFHPLVGLSPIFACGLAALQGLKIADSSLTFFSNGANPGGLLLAPGKVSDETLKRLRDYWNENYTGANRGKVAALGDNLQYKSLTVSAVDSQLIEQLNWTGVQVASCFRVPYPLIDSSHVTTTTANNEPLLQLYYSQCLQSLMTGFEYALDEGLELDRVPGKTYGTEFDIDDLIWMDTATKTKAAHDAIIGGGMAVNEARYKFYGLGPVAGGDTPYLQQQMFSLAALAERDRNQPFAKPAPGAQAPPLDEADDTDTDTDEAIEKAIAPLVAEIAALRARVEQFEQGG